MLRTQYRMADGIMNLANHLVYNGQLRCASVEVARAVLSIQLRDAQLAAMAPWLQRVRSGNICHALWGPFLHEQNACCLSLQHPAWCVTMFVDIFQALAAKHSVFFLDTSGPGAFERQAGETLSNPAEAHLIVQLVDVLQLGGVPLSTIGVMSPYRLQVCMRLPGYVSSLTITICHWYLAQWCGIYRSA